MNQLYTRRGKTQDNYRQNHCHSRKLVSGIYDACSYVREPQTACVEEPRLQPSGMTTLLNVGQVIPNNQTSRSDVNPTIQKAPSTWRERAECVSTGGVRGVFKEEALNKNDFRAPLRSGFTLIELLVIVLIIGILAAVALPQYQRTVMKSRVMQVLPSLKAIRDAEEIYYLTHGEYTDNIASLDISTPLLANNWQYMVDLESQGNNKSTNRVQAYYTPYGNRRLVIVYRLNINSNGKTGGILYCSAAPEHPQSLDACKQFGNELTEPTDSPRNFQIAY